MKLIDADGFAKKAYDVAYPVVHGRNDHERGLTLLGMAQLLDEMPAVDAIPIEWIEQKMKELDTDTYEYEWLIAEWRIENYGKTD